MKVLLDLAERTVRLQYGRNPQTIDLVEDMIANKENWLWVYNEEDCHYAISPRTADGRGPPYPFNCLKYDYHDVAAITSYRRQWP